MNPNNKTQERMKKSYYDFFFYIFEDKKQRKWRELIGENKPNNNTGHVCRTEKRVSKAHYASIEIH